MKTELNVCYSEKSNQYLDLYLPEAESFPLFVYFHGGGLASGDKADCPLLYDYLVSHGIAVATANYRMYPNAAYPDFLLDAAEAVAWAFKNAEKYGNIQLIYVGGSSAGGYISQMLCFDERLLSAHGLCPADIAGFVHDAGQPTCHFNLLKERGLDTRRIIVDDTAPLFHIEEAQNYPPMLIIVSDNDMQNRYEQTMLLVSTLKHFGYGEKVALKIMNGTHCAYVNAADEQGDSVLGKLIKDFIVK